MKKIIVVLIFICFALSSLYLIVIFNSDARDRLSSSLKPVRDKLYGACRGCPFLSKIIGKKDTAEDDSEEKITEETIALYFKDGSVMVGELLSKTKDEYIIRWKGQETVVFAGQIERVGSPKKALASKAVLTDEEITEWWPYDNDVVIRLTNRSVLDGEIRKVEQDKLTVRYVMEGGGYIEQELEKERVEYLIFKPIEDRESKKIEGTLRELFPDMTFYKEGNFTIVTDADITWVKEYRKTLRSAYTDIYLDFFDLFRDRKPHVQNFIVIFDDYGDYIEYAITDGVPGWAAAGYFSPEDKILYLFNVLGEKFSKILFDAWVGETGKRLDDIVEAVEERVDSRYHIFIEGQAKAISDKFWRAYSYYKGVFREATLSTLRHEFAHGIFNNWGLQNIVLSRTKRDEERLIEKKKEFLETKDNKKKAELVKSLMLARREEPLPDMMAANSWLSEGVATYCETEEIGARNDRWLYIYQQMAKDNLIYPLESLSVYKIGSFPGVCSEAMIYLYAQSWAYVNFFMNKYPKEFLRYQKKMAEKGAKDYEDVSWLLECLGKDLREIDKEFTEYMNTFEELDDPYVRYLDKMFRIAQD